MKYMILKNYNNLYLLDKYNDEYLSMLSFIFDDGVDWTEKVKDSLLNPESLIINGNKTEIIINKKDVTIQPLHDDTPEEWAITINREALLDIINKWQELVNKKTKEILFVRHGNAITITEHND